MGRYSGAPVPREQPVGEAGGQAVREERGRGAAAAEGGEGGVEGGRVEARLPRLGLAVQGAGAAGEGGGVAAHRLRA